LIYYLIKYNLALTLFQLKKFDTLGTV
jgi:hypothetical protein